ncbi:Smr/MutS family protein [Kordiimonas gwangyangensis]|uniref:Smr/MutS family protein n=1 Tax=Kordiimonas gwangyangensis TaxID=288022 RepID=UPI0003729282|nr:Smr/MutS family protein [Kordiimonas gwangyangensis]
MARKKDPLSARDREIWQKVTESVQPLGKRGDAPPLAPLPKIYIQEETRSLPMEWHTRPSPKPDNSIDRRMQRQIATGRQEVDRSVDLHGMTQDRAFATLKRTIEGAIKRGDKTLLVVTGKGGRRFNQLDATPAAYRTRADFDQLGGVLRRMVPLWLEGPDLKPFIQSYGTASPDHGGDGALYVILRRRMPGSRKDRST